MERIVFALGGNAILQPNQEATYENQLENVRVSAEFIAKVKQAGYEIVITHGNGPQVGNILRQNEEAKEVVPALPLSVCNAESQGFIGYMLEQTLRNELTKLNESAKVVTLLTEVEVSLADEAFVKPTKPIGVFYSQEEAEKMAKEEGWVMAEDAGRGYRRVVASPQPVKIHGVEAIKTLLATDTLVVAGGGGGIPVYQTEEGAYKGVDAVIDKDRTGKKLAEEVDADVFVMLTDISNVYINYGKENQEKLEQITVSQAEAYMAQGQFAAGSMGPKVEAAIAFAKQGKRAIICSLFEAKEALEGQAGTHIVAD